MNKFILVMLTVISTQVFAGEFKIGIYATKLNDKEGSHNGKVSGYYNGYRVIDNRYYTTDDGANHFVGDDYWCCSESAYNNDLKYISVEYSDYGYSVKLSTYEDVYSDRAYVASAYKSFRLVESVNASLGFSVDNSLSFSPSMVISYDKYFISPSLEIDRDNVSVALSVRF